MTSIIERLNDDKSSMEKECIRAIEDENPDCLFNPFLRLRGQSNQIKYLKSLNKFSHNCLGLHCIW